jgi:hypothetical protein
MVAGPLVVNYLGSLMVLSSQGDFPLTLSTSNSVYNYIQYPDSFRATLVQLSHEMYEALLSAHNGMDRIQTFTAQIPGHINTTLKLVTRASPTMIKGLLPNTLANIIRLADICVTAANTTVEKFERLQNLIEEIIRVALNTQAATGTSLTTLQEQISNGTKEVELLNGNVTSIREQYEIKRRALEKARQEYWNATNSLPGPAPRRNPFSSITNAVWSGVTAPITAIGCVLNSCSSSGSGGSFSSAAIIDNTAFTNAMEIAKLKLEELKRAEAEHDKWFQLQLGHQYQLAALIQQMASLSLSTMPVLRTIEILKQAFTRLQDLKVQWSKVRRFFLSVSLQAESTKELISLRFVNVIEDALASSGLLADEDREFFVELILIAAEEIERNTELLYIMAKTYFDISNKYMINQIAGVNRLIGLDSTEARAQALNGLQNDTLTTSTKVSNLVQERQLAYKLRLENRRAQLENYLATLAMEELQLVVG